MIYASLWPSAAGSHANGYTDMGLAGCLLGHGVRCAVLECGHIDISI